MYPETPDFEQWRKDREPDLESTSKETDMGQKLEDTAKEAIVALETLRKHLERREEERTLYTAALAGVYGSLSVTRPSIYRLLLIVEELVKAEDSGSTTDRAEAMENLRAELARLKS